MIFTPLVCLALALNEPSAAELVVRSYSLEVLRPAVESSAIRTLPLRPGESPFEGWSDEFEFESIEPELLVHLVREVVEPDEWEYAGRSLDVYEAPEPRLEVVASPDIQQQVERVVEFVRAAVATPITVRLDVYRIGDGPIDALPRGTSPDAPRRLDALVKSGTLTRDASYTLPLVSGIPALRTRLERRTFLRDYDAEIAEASCVLHPVVDQFSLGVAVAVRADRDRDGRALVRFAVRDAWLEDLMTESGEVRHRIASENHIEMVPSGGAIQSPRVAFASMTGSCLLSAGSTSVSYAVSPEKGTHGRGVVVAITVVESPQVARKLTIGDRSLYLVNLAGDVAQGFCAEELGTLTTSWPPTDDQDEPLIPVLPIGPSGTDGMHIAERAIDRVIEGYEGDAGYGTAGTFLYVFGPPDAAEVGAAVAKSIPSLAANRSVTCDAPGGPAASLPVAVGEALVICGSQETYIHDYDVDVANRVSMSHPNVYAGLSGFVFHVAGREAKRATLHTHLRDGGRGEFDAESDQYAVHHQPSFLVSTSSTTAPVGSRVHLGDVPLSGGRTAAVEVGVDR